MAAEPNNLPNSDPAALVARIDALEALLAEKMRAEAELVAKIDALPMRLLEAAHQIQPPLMSVKDVGRTLGISQRKAETIIGLGELRPIWIGGQRKFDPRTVAAYVASCAKKSAA